MWFTNKIFCVDSYFNLLNKSQISSWGLLTSKTVIFDSPVGQIGYLRLSIIPMKRHIYWVLTGYTPAKNNNNERSHKNYFYWQHEAKSSISRNIIASSCRDSILDSLQDVNFSCISRELAPHPDIGETEIYAWYWAVTWSIWKQNWIWRNLRYAVWQ